jgi:tetraprenyl-beta-curcumene synthase
MPPAVVADPLPLRPSQLRALLCATARELVWGRKAVSHEIRQWHAMAERIPDARLRTNALDVLTRKRGNTDGAALFWTLARHRDVGLLRLLVAHELIWDFLDDVSESGADAGAGEENSRQLHLAIVESLDPDRPISNYYRLHPWRDDGGYLRALVIACRRTLHTLPSYSLVRSTAIREANRAQVQSLNHEPAAGRRDCALREWAAVEYPTMRSVSWFELTAAASASLVIHALLALAAEPRVTPGIIADTYAVYFPWVSLATVMLDSYVDQAQDAATGAHSYFTHYASNEQAVERLQESITQSARGALRLPNGERHAVLVACMIAMYLSKDTARSPELRATTRDLARAGGSLTRLLLPILRAWRIRHGQREA